MSYKTNLSDITQARRNQIKALQDEFMTFSWGGLDAFDNFGAFIINEKKGSLKFYNGPGFSNEYTKPQFDSGGGELMGVNFNKQTISFTIGVYWISIEDYRKLLNWLHPLKVDYLIFGFSPNYRYNVKLSSRSDSTRYIIGKENGDPRYYTELTLNFEVQGTPCAIGVHSYEFGSWNIKTNTDPNSDIVTLTTSINDKSYKDFIESDLPTPLEIPLRFKMVDKNDITKTKYFTIKLSAVYEGTTIQEQELFSIVLKNLTLRPEDSEEPPLYLNLKYNSETGLLYLKYGNSNDRILSLLNTSDTGEKIVDSFLVNKFVLPGQFNYPEFKTEKLQLKLIIQENEITIQENKEESNTVSISEQFYNTLMSESGIICYPRTNII